MLPAIAASSPGMFTGELGTVDDLKKSKTGHWTITVRQGDGIRFRTLARNVTTHEP